MVFFLDDDTVSFPDPKTYATDGLFAIGGKLNPHWLLLAYSNGIFPWFGFKESSEIEWWCPRDRFVLIPEKIHISHSMRQLIKQNKYVITMNKDFAGVIRNCSKVNDRYEERGAWLGDDMIMAYTELFALGYAESVEIWDGEQLVGGLYGVSIGKNFCGESMFSLVPNASKLALIALAKEIGERGGIIDCQFETDHLKSMGGCHITYEEYMEYFAEEEENC